MEEAALKYVILGKTNTAFRRDDAPAAAPVQNA